MSHGKEKITALNRRIESEKKQQRELIDWARQASQYWYRTNERVKKIHNKEIGNFIFYFAEVRLGRKSFLQWLSISPLKYVRQFALWLLIKTNAKNLEQEFSEKLNIYLHEYLKWQIEEIMGGQVPLTPRQIGIKLGHPEEDIRNCIQEIASDYIDLQKNVTSELASRQIIKDNSDQQPKE